MLPLAIGLQVGLPSVSHASGGILQGVVKNEAGDPIAGATVTLHEDYRSVSVVADTYGYYEMPGLYESSPDIQVVAPGYRPIGMFNVPIAGEGATPVDFELTPYSGTLPGAWKAGSQTSQHLVLLAADGTVWTVGDNDSGQLGDGTTINRTLLSKVPGLTDVVQVATGEDFTLALKSDGTVWAWGENGSGQLGDGTTVDRWLPVKLPLKGIVSIAAGKYHALATDGTKAWSWGDNWNSQLGYTTPTEPGPQQVPGLTGVTSVAAGDFHSAALAGGTVYTWGSNSAGQLGIGSYDYSRDVPTEVTGVVGNVSMIASSDDSMLAFAEADGVGTLWGWGYGGDGQLGTSGSYNSYSPVAIGGIGDVKMLAGGDHHSLALTADGKIYAWGGNGSGQLGTGDDYTTSVPKAVVGLDDIAFISSGERTSYALRNDGSFWYWGQGDHWAWMGLPVHQTLPYLVPAYATVIGVVTDDAGVPVSGATVWSKPDMTLYGPDSPESFAKTGPDGTFSLTLLPLPHTLGIKAAGYFPEEPLPGQVFQPGEIRTLDYVLTKDPTQFPTIHLAGEETMYLKVGETFADPGYTAGDVQDGDMTEGVVVTGSVDTAVAGTYTLTYAVTDTDGIEAKATRIVVVLPADDATPVAHEAQFIDVDLNAGTIGGTLRWRVSGDAASTSFQLLFADAGKNIVGTVGSQSWTGAAAAYSFPMHAGTPLPTGAVYLVIAAGTQGAAYVPIADVTSPEQLASQVRTAGDKNKDGFGMNDVAAFLRYETDLTGDGTFDRADVSLVLDAIPSYSFQ